MDRRKIVLGLGGSSGAIYAKVLLDKLQPLALAGTVELGLVMSSNALTNWQLEGADWPKPETYAVKQYDNHDFMAPFASGSAKYDTMILCPCSMGLLGRIATGVSTDLMTRAADVMLKERRKLILVPRETPLSLIHLRNMVQLTEAGAIICPAIPSFYSGAQTMEGLAATVVDRVLALAGFDLPAYQWGTAPND
jgi:4-hydroxy-3-polyprenylbenzoate decarboxylase